MIVQILFFTGLAQPPASHTIAEGSHVGVCSRDESASMPKNIASAGRSRKDHCSMLKGSYYFLLIRNSLRPTIYLFNIRTFKQQIPCSINPTKNILEANPYIYILKKLKYQPIKETPKNTSLTNL